MNRVILSGAVIVAILLPRLLLAQASTEPATQPSVTVTTQPSATTQPAEAATQPSATTQPLAATQPSGSVVQLSASTQPVTRPGMVQIKLNFKDAPVESVLDYLSESAGFIVVREAGQVPGRITLLSKQPVTADEAVTLLNSALKVNNFTAIQMGRILKVTTLDKAKKENIPVHFGADPALIELSDQLITQIIPVKTVDAVKLKTDLTSLVDPSADFSSNAMSNTLIITDTSANIHRLVEIVASMDKKDATENGIRVKQLKYADATAAAKLINDMFNPQSSANQQQGGAMNNPFSFLRAMRGGGGPGGPGGGGGGFPGLPGGTGSQDQADKGQLGKVLASADTRTNTVVFSGPADTLKVIDEVLTQLDSNPVEDQAFFLYSVKNGQATDMSITLNALFGANTGSTNRSSNTVSGRSTSSGNTFGVGSSSSFGGSSSNRSSGGSTTGAPTAGNRTTPGQSQTGVGGLSSAATTTAAALLGQVYVVADADTNSLLVATASKYQDRVKDIIKELDRPVPQVLIKALIAEVTHDKSVDFGLDFSVLNIRPSGNGSSLTSDLGNAAANTANGGMAVAVAENTLKATLHALAVDNKLDVLSRPYILTSDNQEAIISVGYEVPIITESRLDTNNNTINTIQYTNIGIILDVTPHINPEGLVVMDVAPQISSQYGQGVEIQPGVNSPEFEIRSASARVAIDDGQTIVIGGLMQDQKTQTVNKIPLLGDIPLLGALFSRNNSDKQKTELLIFMTPHVAKLPAKLHGMSQDEVNGLKLTPNAVEPGTFQEHIRGMERGGSTTQPTTRLIIPTTGPSGNSSTFEPTLPGGH